MKSRNNVFKKTALIWIWPVVLTLSYSNMSSFDQSTHRVASLKIENQERLDNSNSKIHMESAGFDCIFNLADVLFASFY